jgi:hypothetical protein
VATAWPPGPKPVPIAAEVSPLTVGVDSDTNISTDTVRAIAAALIEAADDVDGWT